MFLVNSLRGASIFGIFAFSPLFFVVLLAFGVLEERDLSWLFPLTDGVGPFGATSRPFLATRVTPLP